MPNIKSAIKRVELSEKRRLRNKMMTSRLKTVIKKFQASLVEGNKEVAEVNLNQAIKAIDMACTKGILKKNTASRRKSVLQNNFNRTFSA